MGVLIRREHPLTSTPIGGLVKGKQRTATGRGLHGSMQRVAKIAGKLGGRAQAAAAHATSWGRARCRGGGVAASGCLSPRPDPERAPRKPRAAGCCRRDHLWPAAVAAAPAAIAAPAAPAAPAHPAAALGACLWLRRWLGRLAAFRPNQLGGFGWQRGKGICKRVLCKAVLLLPLLRHLHHSAQRGLQALAQRPLLLIR